MIGVDRAGGRTVAVSTWDTEEHAQLAPDALGLAYTLEPAGPNCTAVVAWEPDPVSITADEAMQADLGKGEKKDGDQAQVWLREALQEGPMPAADVLAQGRANGFSEKLVRLAFHDLGCQRKKSDFKGGWLWWLPSGEDAHSPHGESSAPSQISNDSHEDAEDARNEEQESSGAGEWGIVA